MSRGAILSDEKRAALAREYASGRMAKVLAREYGVHVTTVRSVAASLRARNRDAEPVRRRGYALTDAEAAFVAAEAARLGMSASRYVRALVRDSMKKKG